MTEVKTSDPVSLAIVSPARWGRLLLDAVEKSLSLVFAGVFSRSAENRDDIVNRYGGKSYDSYEALLKDPDVNGVLLPTPHFLHHPQAIAALKSGKHVFVEKPMANTLDECLEMKNLAEEKNLALAVGLQNRWVGSAWKVKSMIENGELGDIATASAMLGATLIPQYTVGEDWELDEEKIPGGPLDNLAVHQVDLLLYFLGPVKRVCGHVSNSLSPTEVPSMATASLEFESGAVASLMSHQVSAFISQISIYGTKAAVHYKRAGQELLWEEILDPVRAKHLKPEIIPLDWDGPENFTTALQAELEDFGNCIRTGAKPRVGTNEGIASLRVIRAIMESSKTGRHVEL
jgi:UDP-N-acetyl-2-amino-2-deoxyglucuronate dehydrogenase